MEKDEKKVVHVRVSGGRDRVEIVGTMIAEFLKAQGLDLIEHTVPYPNRVDPSEARVYVTVVER